MYTDTSKRIMTKYFIILVCIIYQFRVANGQSCGPGSYKETSGSRRLEERCVSTTCNSVSSFYSYYGINTNEEDVETDSFIISLSIPEPIQDIKVTEISEKQLTLSWTKSMSLNVVYKIFIDDNECDETLCTLSGSDNGAVVTGLNSSTDYTIGVEVHNYAITNQAGIIRTPIELRTKGPKQPGRPTWPGNAANFLRDGDKYKIELRWNKPSDDGGSPILSYQYNRPSCGGNNGNWILHDATTTSLTISDITKDSTQRFVVRAKNAIGDSEPSVEMVVNVPGISEDILVDATTGSDNDCTLFPTSEYFCNVWFQFWKKDGRKMG